MMIKQTLFYILLILLTFLFYYSVGSVKEKGILYEKDCRFDVYSCNSLGPESNWQKAKGGKILYEKIFPIYEGEYTVNIFGKIRPNGFGIYRDALGRNYEGEWKDGLIYGKGTYTYFTIKFVGEYKDEYGSKTGKQIWPYWEYIGVWEKGKKFVGTLYLNDRGGTLNDGGKMVFEYKELIPRRYFSHWIKFPANILVNIYIWFKNTFLKGKDYYITTYDKDGNIIGNQINDCELGKGPLGAGAGYDCSGGALQRDNSMYDGQFYYFFPSRPNYPLD